MSTYESVIEDTFATVEAVIVIAVLCVVAGGLVAAGLDMSLFFNTIGMIIAGVGIIGTVSFAVWVYSMFSENSRGYA